MVANTTVNATGQPYLSATGLSIAYIPGIDVISDVSIEVGKGEVVCLLGRNGAGKTTLIKGICGLLPLRSGRVFLQGEDLTGLPPRRIVGAGIAVVPEGRCVFPSLSVAENLAMGHYSRKVGFGPRWQFERAYELFPKLYDRRNQLAGTLSGGEQQMVAMARALMAEPKMLLLDEPSMGLAPMLIELVFDTINRLASEGMTILLVEQNASEALDVADRAYVLERGSIQLAGTAAMLERDPLVRQSYLGA